MENHYVSYPVTNRNNENFGFGDDDDIEAVVPVQVTPPHPTILTGIPGVPLLHEQVVSAVEDRDPNDIDIDGDIIAAARRALANADIPCSNQVIDDTGNSEDEVEPNTTSTTSNYDEGFDIEVISETDPYEGQRDGEEDEDISDNVCR